MDSPIVLNADPDPETRNRISRILSHEGVRVMEADNALECLRLVTANPPAAVVIARDFGTIRGVELLKQIGAISGTKRLLRFSPAIEAEMTAQLSGCDAEGFIPDPVDPTVLACSVRSLLRLCEAERENSALAEQLRHSRDDLQLFLYRITHDFLEPFRAISTFVEMVGAGANRWTPAEAQYMTHVTSSVDRSRRLIHYLMSYAQIVRESAAVHRTVHLSAVMIAAQSELRKEIEEAGAQLDVRTEELPDVHGNPVRLQQLFTCLLKNSLAYRGTEAPPRIRVLASRDTDPFWTITVEDNGMGIAPEFHENIFTPFYRRHGREIPGTGMGLTLCRKIVEAHGGAIWVESALGTGATFHFRLPAAGAAAHH